MHKLRHSLTLFHLHFFSQYHILVYICLTETITCIKMMQITTTGHTHICAFTSSIILDYNLEKSLSSMTCNSIHVICTNTVVNNKYYYYNYLIL